MAGLDGAELRVGADYERARAAARAEAIELRRRRRIHLGDLVSLVFENRQTLRAAAEEALRSERVQDPAGAAAEAARFAVLLPEPGTLAASLYVDIADASELADLADDIEEIAGSVRLEVAGGGATTEVLASRSSTPAAFLRFALTEAQREAWLEGAPVRVAVSHPRCAAATALSDEQRAALALDLGRDAPAASPSVSGGAA